MSNNERQRLDLLPAAGNRVVISLSPASSIPPSPRKMDGRVELRPEPARVHSVAQYTPIRLAIRHWARRVPRANHTSYPCHVGVRRRRESLKGPRRVLRRGPRGSLAGPCAREAGPRVLHRLCRPRGARKDEGGHRGGQLPQLVCPREQLAARQAGPGLRPPRRLSG